MNLTRRVKCSCGVIIRPMGAGMPSAIRVTVGTREQNERMLAALEQVLRQ